MKYFKSVLFACAGLIIFLHSLVAHDHQKDTGLGHPQYNSQASIFDQIALGFHLAQPDGHLEDFTPDQPELEFSPELLAVLDGVFHLNLIAPCEKEEHAPAAFVPSCWHTIALSEFSHRGPPVI